MVQITELYTYSLKLDYGVAAGQEIEFVAEGADAAAHLVQRVCGNRPVQLFRGGERLAHLKPTMRGGLWVVSA